MPTSIANGFKTRSPAALPLSFIQEDLDRVEHLLTERFAQYTGPFGPLVGHLRHYRGKRVRPVLLLLIGHACGRVGAAHHTLAAVMEMIHTATLVHDDVLDDAKTRRHVRTVNAGWGNQVSILLGDLLFTHAFHLSSTLGDAEVCRWIGETTNRVSRGELRQLTERGNLSLSEQDYFSIIEGKTAALTECCGRLGAWQSGASTAVTNAMSDFGRNIGMAFQIADDVLDLCGDERTVGQDAWHRSWPAKTYTSSHQAFGVSPRRRGGGSARSNSNSRPGCGKKVVPAVGRNRGIGLRPAASGIACRKSPPLA